MIINKTSRRLKKIVDLVIITPRVHMTDVVNGLYHLKTSKGDTTMRTMNERQFRRWYESLGDQDVVIIDDIRNE